MIRKLMKRLRTGLLITLLAIIAAGPVLTACGVEPLNSPKATDRDPEKTPDDGTGNKQD